MSSMGAADSRSWFLASVDWRATYRTAAKAVASAESATTLEALEPSQLHAQDSELQASIGSSPEAAARRASYGHERQIPPMQIYFTSTYSSMPYFDPSRPMPDCLTPPKGATSVVISPVFTPTMPYSRASATRQIRPMSRE